MAIRIGIAGYGNLGKGIESQINKNLMYIACTRALHKLTIINIK